MRYLYVPGESSATMAILSVSADGKLTLLGVADTAIDAHCVLADGQVNAWVCGPDHGQLLLVKGPFPASSERIPTSEVH